MRVSRSRMSVTSKRTSRDRTSATFSRLPFTRLSTITTRSSRAASCRTSSDPMKPAPPVTTTVDRSVDITPLYSAAPRHGGSGASRSVFNAPVPFTPAHEPRGHARDDRKRGHILGHHRSGADDGPSSDGDSRKDHRIDTDVRPGAHANRTNPQVGLNDRHVARHAGVLGSQHSGTRTASDRVLEHQIASVEVALRPEPDIVAD